MLIKGTNTKTQNKLELFWNGFMSFQNKMCEEHVSSIFIIFIFFCFKTIIKRMIKYLISIKLFKFVIFDKIYQI